ncbi:SDR family oxidoreductase [Fulvivirga sp. M361]|uniref:SDR family oxidoreductase n=1 Tax=Fulvivirga sp. M361 TaxID=2594266 RepID=UPI00117B9CE0|nr:SDR family oxidoreductase [Fulvivirga sp. M361]TRX54280.1 SDR family oxidoreductase [Fulvivirga sp. M361]
MNTEGKVAIVTGASKGIGYATVRALLEAGCKVAGWSRSEVAIDHPDFNYYSVDVGDSESVKKAYNQTVKDLEGDVAILINNAGLGYEGPLETLDHKHWQQMFKVNVDGVFYCSQLVIPQMRKNDEGHIINVSSIAGTTGLPGLAAYCSTKHAVRGLSHSLYKEVRNDGVKVTCIYPGSVNTSFFDAIDSITANENMMRPEDIAETIVHCIQSHPNYHHVDIEVRPLKPKG